MRAVAQASFLISTLVSQTALLAQEPVAEAPPIVVTLSALPFPMSLAPGSLTVIDRATIEASGAATLEDVLRTTPFVDLSRTGARGGLTTITLRGGDPNFTLVLLDGVPVNDPTNILGGSFDFSTLSADNVERVEIVRGPLSSRFGSEAIAGVVHIVSRRGRDDPGWNVEAAAGSFGAREARLGSVGAHGPFDYSLGASWMEVDEQVESDPFRLGTVAAAAGLTSATSALRVTSRFHDSESEGFPENGGGPRFSILRETKRSDAREVVLGLELRRTFVPAWTVTAGVDGYWRNGETRVPPILDAEPPGPLSLPGVEQDNELDRRRLTLTSTWESANGVFAILSSELRREEGESDAVIAGELPADFTLDRTTRAAAGEIGYRSEVVSMDLALRVDDPEGFDTESSPRVGAAWRFRESGTRLMASWGEGFKLPSFFALGEPNIGNPELGPERSSGFDFGLEQRISAANLVLSATWFRQRYRDLIDFSPEEFRLVNRRLARSRGVELEAVWRPDSALAVTAHSRWLDAELEGTEERLRDRPRWRGGATLDWRGAMTQIRLDVIRVGERFDFQIPVPERMIADAYTVASLALSRRMSAVTVFGRIDNLFDADYEEFVGFPAPGRAARVGLRYGR